MDTDNEQYLIKNETTDAYYIKGSGFTGTEATATRFDDFDDADEAISALETLGNEDELEIVDAPKAAKVTGGASCAVVQNEDGTSFAVSFVRPKDLNTDGTVKSHKLNPSKRRFKTKDEAWHHASRFVVLEGHLGAYITVTKDPVNSYVNKVTGFTNPGLDRNRSGKAREAAAA